MKNLMDKLNSLPKAVQLVIAILVFAAGYAFFYYLTTSLLAP